ncbi:MAG: HNH endonuclease [Anaerolineales bacterium]|nr:HNH endonuclease [Anaerolineales bacterium]
MILEHKIRDQIRNRADYMCEFCGVSETDSGGELTVDHFKPRSKGGDDHPDNLIYGCIRCNQFKLDYWPENDRDQMLWNPRSESSDRHFLLLDDGILYPLTAMGSFTLKRLRLNRPPLIATRLRRLRAIEHRRLLKQYQSLLGLLEQTLLRQKELIQEQQELLKKQHELLKLLADEQ